MSIVVPFLPTLVICLLKTFSGFGMSMFMCSTPLETLQLLPYIHAGAQTSSWSRDTLLNHAPTALPTSNSIIEFHPANYFASNLTTSGKGRCLGTTIYPK
ncbi:hypothetical protein HOY80DRAFT_963306 [Tuber brumale]|nr:hypothetical protein HOY80DRAFT_963306 [Tuber brumale]